MTNRLISADDHVDLSHDKIKSFLSPRFHDDYDDALREFGRSMGATSSAQSNQRWRGQQGLEIDYDYVPMRDRRAHEAADRAGHSDAVARLKDMDIDGVESSITY